jgi:hypothetical protein
MFYSMSYNCLGERRDKVNKILEAQLVTDALFKEDFKFIISAI